MKYTSAQIKSISKKNLLRLINLGKRYIKENKIVRNMFESYDVDINYLDLIPIIFSDLDVSAQTVKGCIYLNYRLLEDGDFFKDLMYAVHEIKHVLSQITGKKPTENTDELDSEDYLNSPEEKSAFKIQIEYLKDQFGKEEANKYVEHLLNYHDIQDAKLKSELLS